MDLNPWLLRFIVVSFPKQCITEFGYLFLLTLLSKNVEINPANLFD